MFHTANMAGGVGIKGEASESGENGSDRLPLLGWRQSAGDGGATTATESDSCCRMGDCAHKNKNRTGRV